MMVSVPDFKAAQLCHWPRKLLLASFSLHPERRNPQNAAAVKLYLRARGGSRVVPGGCSLHGQSYRECLCYSYCYCFCRVLDVVPVAAGLVGGAGGCESTLVVGVTSIFIFKIELSSYQCGPHECRA